VNIPVKLDGRAGALAAYPPDCRRTCEIIIAPGDVRDRTTISLATLDSSNVTIESCFMSFREWEVWHP